MNISEREFGVGGWVCFIAEPTHGEIDMVSGNVVRKNSDGVTVAVEYTVGPCHNIFFPYDSITEIVSH